MGRQWSRAPGPYVPIVHKRRSAFELFDFSLDLQVFGETDPCVPWCPFDHCVQKCCSTIYLCIAYNWTDEMQLPHGLRLIPLRAFLASRKPQSYPFADLPTLLGEMGAFGTPLLPRRINPSPLSRTKDYGSLYETYPTQNRPRQACSQN